jgi:hypothetical protein
MSLDKWADLHPSDLVTEPPNKTVIAELRAVANQAVCF